MIQEGHIITLPAPVCGSERWAILRLVTHDRARGSSLWYSTLACDLEGERRVIDLGEDTGWLTRRRRGEVVAAMHSSERHAFIMALEALLVEQGLTVVRARTKGDLSLPGTRKPSASGLAPWEILERLDAWALTVEGLRVTSALWGERQRQIRLGNRGLTVGYQGQRWLLWDHGQPTIEVMPEELLDRVVELVRSMRV